MFMFTVFTPCQLIPGYGVSSKWVVCVKKSSLKLNSDEAGIGFSLAIMQAKQDVLVH